MENTKDIVVFKGDKNESTEGSKNCCGFNCRGCGSKESDVSIFEKRMGLLLHDTLKMKVSNRGYRFILSALILINEDESKMHSIMGVLYKEVGLIHNVTPSNAERGMRHAIHSIDYPNCVVGELTSVSEFLCRVHEKDRLGCFDDLVARK